MTSTSPACATWDDAVLEQVSGTVQKANRKKPRLVKDYRRLLEDASIHAVVVATPHHWHIPIAIPVLQSGKDLYVEKPASHVFREGRLLVEAARKYDRIVQHGTQMRSTNVTLRAAEVLKSGLMGEIKMTKAWNVQRGNALEPKPDGPVPDGVDYDRWLGPAPKRPFNPNRFHRSWRVYRDYGNGDMGDDGAHDIDMACWALGVTTHPVRITAHGSTIDLEGEREYPDNMTVALQYAEGKVLLYEDRLWTPYGLHGYDNGNAFYGTEGYMIFSRRGHFQVYMGRKEEKGPGRDGTGVPAELESPHGQLPGFRQDPETTVVPRSTWPISVAASFTWPRSPTGSAASWSSILRRRPFPTTPKPMPCSPSHTGSLGRCRRRSRRPGRTRRKSVGKLRPARASEVAPRRFSVSGCDPRRHRRQPPPAPDVI